MEKKGKICNKCDIFMLTETAEKMSPLKFYFKHDHKKMDEHSVQVKTYFSELLAKYDGE